ncbi:MAG: UDP-3-O-(3-hydroxymyristoyl)glucosamine N-acyltransferase [Nitrosomonadales bacterium]|nr:UDP-3-O-(3-hydroxymyristoyl)glucosamine N-acyltransferase [Nitrosomonadales bacterium]MAS00459.1 UDP-3-O-(3-hydroxymyristoyl)glucosamine N-acyltransferase [Nitrosomonadales bacterium]|tara:strand:+ start:783 stop:1763 length:981 start_codon:yes stop_codon:yes gene_type:complete
MGDITSGKLSLIIDGKCSNKNLLIDNFSSLKSSNESSITFFIDRKLITDLKNTKARVVILKKEDVNLRKGDWIIVDDPYLAFAKVANFFLKKNSFNPYIHQNATIGEDSKISKNCYIGPFNSIGHMSKISDNVIISSNVSIGDNVTIGKGTKLYPNVTIGNNVVIGSNCEIFSNASIGSDGFGYAQDMNNEWNKIPQIGSVIIHDNVDIGSNTTIDRGAIDNTVIKSGVKIDNQVQVGHNCYIDENTIIAGCVGIAGSTEIGKNCKIGGAAMILGHLKIKDNITISPGTMITKSLIKSNKKYTAIMPFMEHDNWLKLAIKLKEKGK